MVWLQRIIGALLGLALFVAAFVFASLFLAFAAAVALVIWGWLWWRTRRLRRELRERQGEVIEGEYRVEHEIRRVEERSGRRRED
jgi:membrane protein implicated in regulation of membrane protease activity